VRRFNNNPGECLTLKQLSIVNTKVCTVKNIFQINENLQRQNLKSGRKEFARIGAGLIRENSDLTTQNRNLVYVLSFVTLLGLSIYTINPEN
jgi:hypothetical protein